MNKSFIVCMWAVIFKILEYISIFSFIKGIRGCISYAKVKEWKFDLPYIFVDIWSTAFLLLAIFFSVHVFSLGENKDGWMIAISIIGSLRVFEVIVYQINVVLFHPYWEHKKGNEYQVKSIRRIIILLLQNYVEIIFWYATIMYAVAYISDIRITTSWIEYITSTILCVATFDRAGLESIISGNLLLMQLAFLETISGLIMTIISLARFIGILPTVDEIDKWK